MYLMNSLGLGANFEDSNGEQAFDLFYRFACHATVMMNSCIDGPHFGDTMPLHPQAQAFIATISALDRPPIAELTIAMARTGPTGLLPPSDEQVGAIADFELPGGDGQPVRARGGPAIAYQVLVYPVTHHAFDTPSYREYGDGCLLTTEGMRWNWNHYLADEAAGRDPLASPLLAPDLRGLPPALVIVAECDPLCDESEAYAKRLADAGVPVDCRRYDGLLHAFFTLGQVFDDGRASVAYAGAALRHALG